MRTFFVALYLTGLGGCATLENENLPTRTDFIFAQAYHIDVDPQTGLTRAHCNKIRNYRVKAGEAGTAEVTYEQFREDGWKPMKAIVSREGDQWIWKAGDPPKCSITIFE